MSEGPKEPAEFPEVTPGTDVDATDNAVENTVPDTAVSASCSRSPTSTRRWAPSLRSRMSWCSSMIALINISGRGGQPGR